MKENNGFHILANGVFFQCNKLQVFFRAFWKRTEWGKFPINIHWCNCGTLKRWGDLIGKGVSR